MVSILRTATHWFLSWLFNSSPICQWATLPRSQICNQCFIQVRAPAQHIYKGNLTASVTDNIIFRRMKVLILFPPRHKIAMKTIPWRCCSVSIHTCSTLPPFWIVLSSSWLQMFGLTPFLPIVFCCLLQLSSKSVKQLCIQVLHFGIFCIFRIESLVYYLGKTKSLVYYLGSFLPQRHDMAILKKEDRTKKPNLTA